MDLNTLRQSRQRPLSLPLPKKPSGCSRKERTSPLLFTTLFKRADLTKFAERNGTSTFLLEDLRIWAFAIDLRNILRFITILSISLLTSYVQQHWRLSAQHGCSSGSQYGGAWTPTCLSPGVLDWPSSRDQRHQHRHGRAWLLATDLFF